MSLVCIVHDRDWAVIASDGADRHHLLKGGFRDRARLHHPKFRAFGDDLVVAATGNGWLCDERLYPAVERFVSEHGAEAWKFRELADHLTANVRIWHSEALDHDDEIARRTGVAVPVEEPGVAVALVGADKETDSIRCIQWFPPAYQPRPSPDVGCCAFGVGPAADDVVTRMTKAFAPDCREMLNIDAYEYLARWLIADASTRHAPVGGQVFSHVIRRATVACTMGAAYARLVGVSGGKIQTLSIADRVVTKVKTEERSRCRLAISSPYTQSIPNAVQTAINYNAEIADVGNLHGALQPSRVTVPTGGDTGFWLLSAGVLWAGNASGLRDLAIMKNGVTTLGYSHCVPANSWAFTQACVAWDDAPAVGDYYEVMATQGSGGSLDAQCDSGVAFVAMHVW